MSGVKSPFSTNSYDKKIAEGTYRRTRLQELVNSPATTQIDASVIKRYVVLELIPDPLLLDQQRIDFYSQKYGPISNIDAKDNDAMGISIVNRLCKNAILAAPVLNGQLDGPGSQPTFLLPFFPPHISLPCKPGEHVWAFFERAQQFNDIGYWFCRIPAPHYVDDVNHTHAPRESEPSFFPSKAKKTSGGVSAVYNFDNNVTSAENDQEKLDSSYYIEGENDAYEKIILGSEASKLVVPEPVPRFKKRPGDLVFEGSNNTLISLGTDRAGPAFITNRKKVKASNAEFEVDVPELPENESSAELGAIDIVVGRSNAGEIITTTGKVVRQETGKSVTSSKKFVNEGNPNYIDDASRIYVAQKTNVDEKLQLSDINDEIQKSLGTQISKDPSSAVFQKSDKIRIVGRQDINIIVANDDNKATITVTADGNILIRNTNQSNKIVLETNGGVYIGNGSASEPIPLGDQLKSWLEGHTHLAVGGATGPPQQAATLPNTLSKKNKVD